MWCFWSYDNLRYCLRPDFLVSNYYVVWNRSFIHNAHYRRINLTTLNLSQYSGGGEAFSSYNSRFHQRHLGPCLHVHRWSQEHVFGGPRLARCLLTIMARSAGARRRPNVHRHLLWSASRFRDSPVAYAQQAVLPEVSAQSAHVSRNRPFFSVKNVQFSTLSTPLYCHESVKVLRSSGVKIVFRSVTNTL